MEKKKRKLSKLINNLKKKGLTKKELDNMFRTSDLLKQMIFNRNKGANIIISNVFGSQQNFQQNYKNHYSKINAIQTSALAKELKVSVKFLQEILDIEIKKQR